MTLSVTTTRVDAPGNDSATSFSFSPMVIFAATDLRVILRASTGTETVLSAGVGTSNYIVVPASATYPCSGSITYPASGGGHLATGDTLVIKRVLPLTQSVSLTRQGAYLPQVQENEFDRLTAIEQQLQAETNRSMKVPETDSTSVSLALPNVAGRANKFLAFDAAGVPTLLVAAGPVDAVVAALQAQLARALQFTGADTFGTSNLPLKAARQNMFLGFDGNGDPVASASTGGGVPVSSAMQPVVNAATVEAALALMGRGSVATVAALRLVTSTTNPAGLCYVRGYASDFDGGEGLFAIGPSVSDNGGTIFVDASSRSWYRLGIKDSAGYSVRWWGAKGDGSTNDQAAFQNAVNFCQTNFVGPVHVPNGSYKLNSVLTVTGDGLTFRGDSSNNTLLQTNSGSQALLLLQNVSRVTVERMWLDSPFLYTAAVANVALNNCVECKLDDVQITGGYKPVQVIGGSADNIISRSKIYNASGPSQLSFANGSGTYVDRVKIDQAWPKGTPGNANNKGAWASGTVYAGFDFVTTGGYILQCMGGGTSAGSAPTPTQFGNNITDGTVTWQTAGAQNAVGVDIDGGSNYNLLFQCDITGVYNIGVQIHTSSGAGPQKNIIRDTEIGTPLSVGVYLASGAGTLLEDLTVDNGILTGSMGIQVNGANETTITGGLIISFTNGVRLSAGSNTIVEGPQIYGCSGNAVLVDANVGVFTLTGIQCGSSSTWGTNAHAIVVQAGTSNGYIITGNNTFGATSGGVTDGGTGATKYVAGNI